MDYCIERLARKLQGLSFAEVEGFWTGRGAPCGAQPARDRYAEHSSGSFAPTGRQGWRTGEFVTWPTTACCRFLIPRLRCVNVEAVVVRLISASRVWSVKATG